MTEQLDTQPVTEDVSASSDEASVITDLPTASTSESEPVMAASTEEATSAALSEEPAEEAASAVSTEEATSVALSEESAKEVASAVSSEESTGEVASAASSEEGSNQAAKSAEDADGEDGKAKKRNRRRRRRKNYRQGRKLDTFEPGEELEGVVRSIQPYGAFVDVGAERDGLIHISELRDGFVEKVEDVVEQEQKVTVRVKEVNVEEGRLSLTMRSGEKAQAARKERRLRLRQLEEGQEYKGKVSSVVDFGAFVDIGAITDGLVHISELSNERVARVSDILEEGQEVTVRILGVDKKRRRISLTMREQQESEPDRQYSYSQSQSQSQSRSKSKPRNGQSQQQDEDDGVEALPSAMAMAFARARNQGKKNQRAKPDKVAESPQINNTIDNIIARMLEGS